MAKQHILLVDDHEVVRIGLKSLLERHPQFTVVGEAGSARRSSRAGGKSKTRSRDHGYSLAGHFGN